MRPPCFVLLAVFLCANLCAEVFTGEKLMQPFVIHGRLSAYNGNPTLRIWIVGSKRILGIMAPEGKEGDLVPKKILDVFDDGQGWFTREMYADFTVEPLAPDIQEHMRPVRILDAKNVVVTSGDTVLWTKKEL